MKKRRFLIIAAAVFASFVLLLLLCRLFCFQLFTVAAGSMQPTLQKGDLILVNKLAYRSAEPQRGDIVLISTAKFPTEKARSDKFWLKRVIAVPADRISIKSPYIYVNGSPLEDFPGVIMPDKLKFLHAPLNDDIAEITLADDRYFLIGDNITVSLDSRHFGPVRSSTVIGKVIYILAPSDRRKHVK